jgi:hypothetical protein
MGESCTKICCRKQEKRIVHKCQVVVYYWTVFYITVDQKVKPCLLKKNVNSCSKVLNA